MSSSLDESGLKALAAETSGRYFRAKDVDSLIKIYNEIDALEPSEKEARFVRETKELYYIPALAALLLLYLFFGLNSSIRRKK